MDYDCAISRSSRSPRFSPTLTGIVLAVVAGAAVSTAAASSHAAMPDDVAQYEASAPAREVARLGYQKFVSDPCSASAKECFINFDTIGADRRLEVLSVSCLVRAAGLADYLEISSGGHRDFFAPRETAQGFFAFNTTTRFLVQPGDTLRVGFYAEDDVEAVNCKVAGEMIVLDKAP